MKKYILILFIVTGVIANASFTNTFVSVVSVIDSLTKLQWQNDSIGTKTNWKGALDRCEALNLDGYTDWRLPNIKELISIIDLSNSSPSINKIFTKTITNYYWSSTTTQVKYTTNDAYTIGFTNGILNHENKTNDFYVRCVRTRQ